MHITKSKLALIISVSLNILLILYIAVSAILRSQITEFTLYNSLTDSMCGDEYQKTLNDFDKQFAGNLEKAAQAKNSFAINVCHRNYKTGQQLDLTPLIQQVK